MSTAQTASCLQYYLNADFNFNLSPGLKLSPKLREVASEWTHHGLLYGLSGNVCLVDGLADSEFEGYIQKTTGQTLTTLPLKKIQKDLPFCPQGWDAKMRSILVKQNPKVQIPLPSKSAVLKANDRLTAFEIERKLEGENISGKIIYREKDLEPFKNSNGPLMLKSRFSSSGLGNKIVETPTQLPHSWIKEELNLNQAFIAENFLKRLNDRACLFDLDAKGKVLDLKTHELLSSYKGGFVGIKLNPNGLTAEPKLESAISEISRQLHQLDYFGPVGVDSFYYLKNKEALFRPLVEINARKTLGHLFHHIYQKLNLKGWACLKFMPRRRLCGPLDYRELDKKLGADIYNPANKTGILLTSPLWRMEQKKKIPLNKLGVFFVCSTHEGILELENKFRKYFEK